MYIKDKGRAWRFRISIRGENSTVQCLYIVMLEWGPQAKRYVWDLAAAGGPQWKRGPWDYATWLSATCHAWPVLTVGAHRCVPQQRSTQGIVHAALVGCPYLPHIFLCVDPTCVFHRSCGSCGSHFPLSTTLYLPSHIPIYILLGNYCHVAPQPCSLYQFHFLSF